MGSVVDPKYESTNNRTVVAEATAAIIVTEYHIMHILN